MKNWAIVGGGLLGMQLANKLIDNGHQVTVLEAGPSMGGLTSVWNLGGFTWDKFYHVILLSDSHLLELLEELGLDKELVWKDTKTGFYSEGQLYSMSNSIEFLLFPPLSLLDKIRLGGTIFYASKVKNWKRLEEILVADWLKKLSGRNTFEKIWLPLLRAKLGENYKHTSAAFIWATIQRMYAARRTGLKKEMFGYVKGGYSTILKSFAQHLENKGVSLECNWRVEKVAVSQGGINISNSKGDSRFFDEVIVTAPSSIIPKICPGLHIKEIQKHEMVDYIGVICVSVLLKKSISPYYVTNITDPTPFTGIIEMTNIVDRAHFGGHTLVYLPKYVKKSDELYGWSDDQIKAFFLENLLGMYDHISKVDVISMEVSRAPYVFPVSRLGYSSSLPSVSPGIPGLHFLNSAHIVNGTLNVNETLQLVNRELPGILLSSKKLNEQTVL